VRAGRYEIERRLGGGGMAEVFQARLVGDEGFSRPVAIKRVLPHLAANTTFVQMFIAEAQLCARLQHPNIVSVIDFARGDDGRPFLVLELVDGPSLADLATPLPIPVAIHIATELLRALAYAHDLPTGETRGIVHRDISPHNVLLSTEGAVKLSDFGIAKARTATSATASEVLKGKPSYMSPEQANGEPLDGRSDLFAVGIVLWEMLVGESLFSGQTTEEMLSRVLFAPIPPPRSVRSEVPADLDRAVMRLLERERVDRPANASEAIDDLVACKAAPRDGREQLIEVIATREPRAIGQASTVRSPARPLPKPHRRSRSSRTLLLVGSAVAIAGLAAVIAILVARRDQAPTTVAANSDAAAANDPWNRGSSSKTGEYYPPDHAYDFTIPAGWHLVYRGQQARLVPDDAAPRSNASMIVSPVLRRTAQMTGPPMPLAQVLEYEMKITGAKLLTRNGPYPARSDYGLTGMYSEIRLDAPTGIEHRLYTYLLDEFAYYELDFTASDDEFEKYVKDYWKAVASIKPIPRKAGAKGYPRPSTLFGE
jgi:serine/threonine protein kinase